MAEFFDPLMPSLGKRSFRPSIMWKRSRLASLPRVISISHNLVALCLIALCEELLAVSLVHWGMCSMAHRTCRSLCEALRPCTGDTPQACSSPCPVLSPLFVIPTLFFNLCPHGFEITLNSIRSVRLLLLFPGGGLKREGAAAHRGDSSCEKRDWECDIDWS